jgi:hypothetical protein
MWRVCENELLSERLPRPLDADQVTQISPNGV